MRSRSSNGFRIPEERHHHLDPRLEAQGLDDGRKEAGRKSRPLEILRGRSSPAQDDVGVDQGSRQPRRQQSLRRTSDARCARARLRGGVGAPAPIASEQTMDLEQVVNDVGDALTTIDRCGIPFKQFQPGVGPYGEPQLIAEVAKYLNTLKDYNQTVQTKRT